MSGVVPERVFLGWDRPLLDSLTTWLLDEGRRDRLSSTLVVVPTSNSGRHLRMALSGQGGVLSPRVMPPNKLFEVNGAATRQEVLWAWIAAIRSVDVADYPRLFPNHAEGSIQGFRGALSLARQMVSLRDMLADGDADFAKARSLSPEKDRWAELVVLEKIMLNNLQQWGLRDPVMAKREQANKPGLPVGVSEVVVACVPDPTRLALRALEGFITRDLPVTVLVNAPGVESDRFDEWGVPQSEQWTKRIIDIPEWRERLHVVDSVTEVAEKCVNVLGEAETASNETALVLCDATLAPALEKTFVAADWPLFNPEGAGLADSGLMCLLRTVGSLASQVQPFEALRELVRLPGAELFLPDKTSRAWAAVLMDRLHNEHLPETLADADFLSFGDQKEILASVSSKLNQLAAGSLVEILCTWLARWLEMVDSDVTVAAETALAETMNAVERLEESGSRPLPEEVFEMLAEGLQTARVSHAQTDMVLDLQGWLEFSYDPASHLVLAGMHEECVPDVVADDMFVPDSLRQELDLRDVQGRFARDAFLFQSAIASRAESGQVDVMVARFNGAGEPRKPSRLLMRQGGQQLAEVVQHLFVESTSSGATGGAWERDWRLRLPERSNPYAPETGEPRSLSPSAIKDYLCCSLRFFLNRIVKMREFDSGKREMDALDFGNLCHGVLEKFGSDDSILDSVRGEEIEDYLMVALDEAMSCAYGKNLTLPLMVQLESARERLRAFAHLQAAERADGWRIVATEFKIGRDSGHVPWDFSGHPIRMIIDRIDHHEDRDQWRVWDYKTSGKAKSPQETHLVAWREQENRMQLGDLVPPSRKGASSRRWADVQLPLYAAFVQQHFQTGDLPQVGYINLPRAVMETKFDVWSGFHKDTFESALHWAGMAIEKIRAGEFRQAAVLPVKEREWDSFAELAPDGLAEAFGLNHD